MKNKPCVEKVVCGYVRVSTDDQARQGTSLERQREIITLHSSIRFPGREVEIASDTRSGRSDRRPGLQGVMRRVRAGEVAAIVAVDVDRLFRNVYDAVKFSAELEKSGTALIIVSQSIDTGTPWGRFVFQVLAAFAEMESRAIGARVARAIAGRKRDGFKGPGTRPFGWRVLADKTLEEDREEQRAIDMAANMRITQASWGVIARAMNAAGFRTVRGAHWTPEGTRQVIEAAMRRRSEVVKRDCEPGK